MSAFGRMFNAAGFNNDIFNTRDVETGGPPRFRPSKYPDPAIGARGQFHIGAVSFSATVRVSEDEDWLLDLAPPQ